MITARHYDNAADILAGAHAVRMKLLRPRNAVIEIKSARDHRRWPTEVELANEPAEHVKAYRRWLSDTKSLAPISFVRVQCILEGISYEMLIGHGRQTAMKPIRDKIVRQTRERFPELPYTKIGLLFNRDPSTICKAM